MFEIFLILLLISLSWKVISPDEFIFKLRFSSLLSLVNSPSNMLLYFSPSVLVESCSLLLLNIFPPNIVDLSEIFLKRLSGSFSFSRTITFVSLSLSLSLSLSFLSLSISLALALTLFSFPFSSSLESILSISILSLLLFSSCLVWFTSTFPILTTSSNTGNISDFSAMTTFLLLVSSSSFSLSILLLSSLTPNLIFLSVKGW